MASVSNETRSETMEEVGEEPRRQSARGEDYLPPPPELAEPGEAARPRRSGAAAGAAAAGVEGLEVERPGRDGTFGAWLRRQREMREIDLLEIADKTKISLRYLKAMEQDRFDVLPAPVFARGFLREYAKYVGLNADEVVNYYLSSHEGQGLDSEEPVEKSAGRPSRGPVTRGAFLVLLLIVAIAATAYFLFYRRAREEARLAAPPPIAAPLTASVPDEVLPPPPEEPVLTAPLVVTLDFSRECWVEARVDGQPEVSKLLVAGESLQIEAQESVTLVLGDAGAVDVQVNGMRFPLDATGGEVRELTIDLATVERLRGRTG
jgi:transcriptional regulator with XRE-family HTH domain